MPDVHPGLDIHPIAGAAARPSRLASGVLTACVYGAIAFSLIALSRHLPRASRKAEEVPKTVNLVFEDAFPSVQPGSGGSGAIDPALKQEVEERLSALDTLEQVPLEVPREDRSLSGLINPQLPVAPGGDGREKGQGGTGVGVGGSGHGAGGGIFRTAAGGGTALPIKDVVRLRQVLPDYPKAAKRMFVEGDVVVRMTIDEQGAPIAVEIVSGHDLLRADTLQAAWQWRFEPIQYQGHPVQATFELVFRYVLQRV
ncbi:MAG TPA: energy transducer TonB [Holophagaceae bacterium]|nr:energy transducer TonB [Holophagaceae bacterium]